MKAQKWQMEGIAAKSKNTIDEQKLFCIVT